MNNQFNFTFKKLTEQLKEALANDYHFIPCKEYIDYKKQGNKDKIIVNRVDIDFSIHKAKKLAMIFNQLGIKATFFIRLHAKEYNPFSFENYKILKFIKESGHEIGYHSEIIDEAAIWDEKAEECLVRDMEILNKMLNIKILGAASHRGLTEFNNLDFWKNKKASDFGLLYEAYDQTPNFNLFHDSFYVSDSDWTSWKCYNKGILVEGDKRSLGEHVKDNHQVIYLLIHSDTYYDEHFYE